MPSPRLVGRLLGRTGKRVVTGGWPAALVLALVFVAGDALSSATAVLAQDDRPDIIVVMVDDLGYIPNERVLKRLPSIREHLIEGGLRFQRMYNETPLCCPARANFLSGQHTLRHGVVENQAGSFDQTDTLATALHESGYHTILAGKYLNGYHGPRVPPGWDRVLMLEAPEVPSFWLDGELVESPTRFVDDITREKAVEWLQQAPMEQPVFALVGPQAPHREGFACAAGDKECKHSPAVMPQDRGAPVCSGVRRFKPPNYMVDPTRRERPIAMPDFPAGWPLREICESLLVVDRMVGELVEAQRGRDRPTFLFFFSDNGMAWGQRGYPLKHVPYASRLPFYVAGPGVPAGSATGALHSIIDITATIADLAGVAMPWTDGLGFMPLMLGEASGGLPELIQVMPPAPSKPDAYPSWEALMTPEWWFIRWQGGERELYRYRQDPWVQQDLAAVEPDLVGRLDQRLRCLIEESRGPGAGDPPDDCLLNPPA